MAAKNIQVAIKVRPLLRKEKEAKYISNWKIVDNSIQLIESQTDPFFFDHIFKENVSNQVIFDKVAKPIVDATLQGFNGTIFAYGQTSSGKTYTMLGDESNPGVMILAAKEIFKEIENNSDRKFLLRVGYIEIYNEKIYDLLNKNNQDLKIHEIANGDVSVNCKDPIITSEAEMMHYLQTGSKLRKCGETNMNERSSRSHALFRMIIESRKCDFSNDDGSVQTSILNLVDLAGSERADQTGATGSRLNEGRHINRSLLYLSCVIKRLSENESDKYINYRDSKLTRILQASLGGNALTAIICTINPTSVEETNSTLSFAMRAKTIKNKPEVNETVSDAAMMKRLEKEITRLKCELEVERNKNSKICENQMRVLQLESRIKEESLKIINGNSISMGKTRRKTWCPTSSEILSENSKHIHSSNLSESNSIHSKKTTMVLNPFITVREEIISDAHPINNFYDNRICNSKILSKRLLDSVVDSKTQEIINVEELTDSSNSQDYKSRYLELLNEIDELRLFTTLEKKFEVEHDAIASLSIRFEQSQKQISELQKQEDVLKSVIDNLNGEALKSGERFMYLESKISQYSKQLENIKYQTKEKTKQIEELLEKNQQLQTDCRDKIDIEYEYEQFRTKCKSRERELIETLNEKDHIICILKRDLEQIRSKEIICNMCNLDNDIVCKLQDNIKLFKSENRRIHKENDELSSQLVELKNENQTIKQSYIKTVEKIISLNLIDELVQDKENLLQNYKIINKNVFFSESNKKIAEIFNSNLRLSDLMFELHIKNKSEHFYISFLQEIQNCVAFVEQKNVRADYAIQRYNESEIVAKFEYMKPNYSFPSQYSENHWNKILLHFNTNMFILPHSKTNIYKSKFNYKTTVDNYKISQKLVYTQNSNIENLKDIDILTYIFLQFIEKIQQQIPSRKLLYSFKAVKDKKRILLKEEKPNEGDLLQIESKKELIKNSEPKTCEILKMSLEDNNTQLKRLYKKPQILYPLTQDTMINLQCFKNEQLLLVDTHNILYLLQVVYSHTKKLLNENEKVLKKFKNEINILKHENDKLIQQNQNIPYLINDSEQIKLLLLKSNREQAEYEIQNKNLKYSLMKQTVTVNKYSEEINLLNIGKNINIKKNIILKNEISKLRLLLNSKITEINSLTKHNSDYSKIIFNNDIIIKQMETECHSFKESSSKLKEYIITLEEESQLLRMKKINALNNIKDLNSDHNKYHDFIKINFDENKSDVEDKLQKSFSEINKLNKLIHSHENSYQSGEICLQTHYSNDSSSLQFKTKNILLHEIGAITQDEELAQKLKLEVDAPRQSSQNDRKYKRQSTHDEKSQCLWDSYRTVSTMTSCTDQLCGCVQLNEKVLDLNKKLLIKDSQIDTLRLELQGNPLKDEVKKFQKMVLEEENEKKKLLLEIIELKQLNEISSRCSSDVDVKSVMKKLQNDDYIEQVKALEEDNRLLKKKYQEAKLLCYDRIQQIKLLEKTPNCNELRVLQQKCNDLKIICRLRSKRIEELEKQIKESNN